MRRASRPLRALPFLALLLASACALHAPAPRLAAAGSGGAVASAETDATAAGLQILAQGGNAVDAAVATALALAVVHPHAGNLGGGGFAVVKSGDEVLSLDFRETAPAAAKRDMYLDPRGEPRPDASLLGPLAAGVPGSPAGLFELHRRLGRLPWPALVRPAARLAREGFVISGRLHDALTWERESLARFPESAAVWLPDGKPLAAGRLMKLPDLAATLDAYADRGPEAITTGRVAAAIVAASAAHGGLLTTVDLAAYRPAWRQPVRFRAFGWEMASMDLPSSGGIILAQTCGMLERLGWSGLPRTGADRPHLLAEIWRRAYADRFLLGDTSNTMATSEQLLTPGWIAERAATIDPTRATPSAEVRPWAAPVSASSGETTHLSVIDAAGQAVSLTTTLNGWFGCGLHVPGAGFLLNNEMDDFTTAPGHPNLFGLIQGEANLVLSGARPLSSMTPTIAWRGGELLALGSRGGSRIPTSTAQVLLGVIVDAEDLAAAVERSRIHHQWLPDQIVVEPLALQPEARAELQRRGHVLRDLEEDGLGEVNAVRRLADGGLEAAADARGPGAAGVARPRP